MSREWVTRWRLQVSAKPVRPGIWKLKGGGFVAHAQVRDPRRPTPRGQRPFYKAILRVFRDAQTSKEAFDWLTAERKRLNETAWSPTVVMPVWKDFAVSILERKIQVGEIQSASTVHAWKDCIAKIIETAPWASLRVSDIHHAHIKDWRDRLPTLSWEIVHTLKTGKKQAFRRGDRYGPRTLVTFLAVARVVWKEATIRFELPRNPMDGIRNFSRRTAKTYTQEQPNSLDPRTEVARFLASMKKRYPRWYAFVLMGFVTGQRPSTLRPIRRKGPNADIDLVAKKLYIRRSNSFRRAVMETTKTGEDLELSLPDELVEVLKEHIARIDASPIGPRTDLLFPNPWNGRLLSPGCLNHAFKNVKAEMGLSGRWLTPRAMRRTFQDLADAAKIRAATAMAVSGHKGLGMKLHYSTVRDDEIEEGIGKVLDLATTGKKAEYKPGDAP